jgi:hypothetical protein
MPAPDPPRPAQPVLTSEYFGLLSGGRPRRPFGPRGLVWLNQSAGLPRDPFLPCARRVSAMIASSIWSLSVFSSESILLKSMQECVRNRATLGAVGVWPARCPVSIATTRFLLLFFIFNKAGYPPEALPGWELKRSPSRSHLFSFIQSWRLNLPGTPFRNLPKSPICPRPDLSPQARPRQSLLRASIAG